MKNLKGIKGVVIISICACLAVGYYFYLSHKDQPQEKLPTFLQQTISIDLQKNYPGTPREVVKFYNRIISCLYNEDISKDDVEILVEQTRKLLDQELLNNNPEELHMGNLDWELSKIHQEEKNLLGVSIDTGEKLDFLKIEGREYAYVGVSYRIQGKSGAEKVEQTYILRKDTEGNWKILGYYQI